MLKFFLIALFVASAVASKVTEDENVELIINGDESLIPEDLLDVNVIKIQDGNVVQSEKFYPIEKEQVQEVIETPAIARPALRLETPVNVPADLSFDSVRPALPVPFEEPSLPMALPAIVPDEVVISPVVPVVPIAPVAPVVPIAPVAPIVPVAPVAPIVPVAPVAPILPVAPVAPIVPVAPVAPVEEVLQPILGEVYDDGRVSVTVNAESEGIFARLSSWVSMVINKFTGSSEEKVKII